MKRKRDQYRRPFHLIDGDQIKDNYLTNQRERGLLKCCFTSTETVGLLGTGAQDVHLDFHTAPELKRERKRGREHLSMSDWEVDDACGTEMLSVTQNQSIHIHTNNI